MLARVLTLLVLALLAAGCGNVRYLAADAGDEAEDARSSRDVQTMHLPDALDVVTRYDAVVQPLEAGADLLSPTHDAGVSDSVTLLAPDGAPELCASLADAYVAALRSGQACAAASDCSSAVCETPCCNCMVFANMTPDALAHTQDLLERWQAAGCGAYGACGATRCAAPGLAACSAEGRCVTLRAP